MSLSARAQRILSEIEHELTATEPRLARILATARLAQAALTAASLLAGIAMLSVGLVLDIIALACVGAVTAQFGLAALGYLCGRLRRPRLRRTARMHRPRT